MTKSLPINEKPETVTIPRESFDNMFAIMEQMQEVIVSLRQELSEIRGVLDSKVPTFDPLLSSAEAGVYCNRTRQTISRWVREGKIKKVRRGGKSGFLKSELDKAK